MCVIFIAESKRPTPEQVAAMYEANGDGCGFAYRINDGLDKDKNPINPRVRWEKGLMTLAEAQKMAAELPLPYVGHCRIQTVGGKKAALCHPFPILKNVPLDLKGTTNGFVLFHNGHWGSWRTSVLEAVWKTGAQIPSGKWSDSRAMAWSAAHFGTAILEFIDEKSVAYSADKVDLTGKDWDEEDGVWYSNKNWKRCLPNKTGGVVGINNSHGSFRSGDGRMGHVADWRPTSATEQANRICKFGSCVKDRVQGKEFCKVHQEDQEKKDKDRITNTAHKNDDLAVRLLADSGFKGGGPVGDGPFDRLGKMWQEKEISKKQYKKARKKMEKMISKRAHKQDKARKKSKRPLLPHLTSSKLSPCKNSSESLSVH